MAAAEIFDSAVRPAGDLAGAFEFDGTTGYFYLCNVIENGNPTVLDHIHLYSGMRAWRLRTSWCAGTFRIRESGFSFAA